LERRVVAEGALETNGRLSHGVCGLLRAEETVLDVRAHAEAGAVDGYGPRRVEVEA